MNGLCGKNGITIVTIGWTVLSLPRRYTDPEFQQMIGHSDKKPFDIVSGSWTVLPGTASDSARYKTQLKKNGVCLRLPLRSSEGPEGIILNRC